MSDEPRLSSFAARNRQAWDAQSSEYQSKHELSWRRRGAPRGASGNCRSPSFGCSATCASKDVLELGCGAAQWSIALHALGARVTGLDNSAVQLEHARELMAQAGVDFPLVHASAEATPFADASFDVVFCDHGAMAFADPHRTVPEAARLLRPGGLAGVLDEHADPRPRLAARQTITRASGCCATTGTCTCSRRPTSRPSSSSPTARWIALFREHGSRRRGPDRAAPAA